MSVAAAQQHDPFGKMLGWSLVLHVLLLASIALAASFRGSPSLLPAPVGEFINISLGQSGNVPGMGGPAGGPVTPTPTPPEPEPPKPEPEPEPPPTEPKVVRPTVEQRDELPMPEAPVKKPSRFEKPKQDSGLRGADAASAPSAELQTGGAGGGQAGPTGLGLGGAGGGSAFDQDFEYAYYVQQMMARIHQHWQRVAVRGTAVVIVRFTILRNGAIQDAEIEQSSGVAILDRASLRAVVLADPLPPLPNSYSRDQVGVHLRFTYSDQF